jgi:hypothetical protein
MYIDICIYVIQPLIDRHIYIYTPVDVDIVYCIFVAIDISIRIYIYICNLFQFFLFLLEHQAWPIQEHDCISCLYIS